MNTLKLAIFDVDGVLLDSLTPHLKICEDKNREYGLGLDIPDAGEFKELVRSGVRISPMYYFFRAVGFPEDMAERAFEDYKKNFMKYYTPAPFPGVHEMLIRLNDAGLKLGIVTSNVRQNVDEALGGSMTFFDERCIFTKDDFNGSKPDALVAGFQGLGVTRDETIYVGDQPADRAAAAAAGVHFLGVTYGWGFSEEDKEFPAASRVSEIAEHILAVTETASI